MKVLKFLRRAVKLFNSKKMFIGESSADIIPSRGLTLLSFRAVEEEPEKPNPAPLGFIRTPQPQVSISVEESVRETFNSSRVSDPEFSTPTTSLDGAIFSPRLPASLYSSRQDGDFQFEIEGSNTGYAIIPCDSFVVANLLRDQFSESPVKVSFETATQDIVENFLELAYFGKLQIPQTDFIRLCYFVRMYAKDQIFDLLWTYIQEMLKSEVLMEVWTKQDWILLQSMVQGREKNTARAKLVWGAALDRFSGNLKDLCDIATGLILDERLIPIPQVKTADTQDVEKSNALCLSPLAILMTSTQKSSQQLCQ